MYAPRFSAYGCIGSIAPNKKMFVHVSLRVVNRLIETIMHERKTSFLELSIQGAVVNTTAEDIFMGDIPFMLKKVTEPTINFTPEELRKLHDIWLTFNMNGLRPACAHQMKVYYDTSTTLRPRLIDITPCPITKRTYTNRFLVEQLTPDTIDFIFDFGSKLKP